MKGVVSIDGVQTTTTLVAATLMDQWQWDPSHVPVVMRRLLPIVHVTTCSSIGCNYLWHNTP